ELDASFGKDGIVVSPFDDSVASSVAVQPDGKIVVSGIRGDNLVVRRYLSNGAPDVTFGCLGSTEADFGGFDWGFQVALQPDARILAVGRSSGRNGSNIEDFVLARFTPDGSPGACGYVVDAFGGLHGFGVGTPARPPAAVGALYRAGVDFARGVAVSP